MHHTKTPWSEKWEDDEYRLHREDGPALITASEGERWYRHGKKHRADGPAWIKPDGTHLWFLNGKKHRVDGPAVIYHDGGEEWWLHGRLHRVDGPAFVSPCKMGGRALFLAGKAWFRHGKKHRVDGPAVIQATCCEWWVNGEKQFPSDERSFIDDGIEYHVLGSHLHRVDGPALIRPDGTQAWFIKGWPHRVDGPAIIHPNGTRKWFLFGKEITTSAERWMEQMNASLPFDEPTTVMFRLSFAEHFR